MSVAVTFDHCRIVGSGPDNLPLSHEQEKYVLSGAFWDRVSAANDKAAFSFIGISLLACFVFGWTLSKLLITHSGGGSGCGGVHDHNVDAESSAEDVAEAGCCLKGVTYTVAVAAAADNPVVGAAPGKPEVPATPAPDSAGGSSTTCALQADCLHPS